MHGMTDAAPDIVRRAAAAFNAGRRDDAQKLCVQGLARAPGEPMLSHLLAAVLFAGGEAAAARQAWQAILKAIPEQAEALARLGRLAWEDGDYATAASCLERAAQHDPPASVWFDLGLARQDLRDHDGAADAYRRALGKKADYAEAALNLGIVLQEKGDADGALGAYREAYRLRPGLFGTIAMALSSAPHGGLWIEEAELRRSLTGA